MREQPTSTKTERSRSIEVSPLSLALFDDATQACFVLPDHDVTFGRDTEADFPLAARGVSRFHAKIVRNARYEPSVVDLGSKNGTFLNERRIEAAELMIGDILRLGEHISFRVLALGGAGEVFTAPNTDFANELTPREREIVQLLSQGYTNRDIASTLGIDVRTIETHLRNAFHRSGAKSRAELAYRWGRSGR